MSTTLPQLKPADFASDQDIRWCPGCGDYSILAQVKKVLPDTGLRPENLVFVSGIGCSSRFPYYMNSYGIHSIHGRAAAVATGVKTARPELDVWVVTGDGDGLSIGGNHTMHLIRRNLDIVVLLFNNRIYGLTKGQYSPTSEKGKKTKSTPYGSVDNPIHPVSFALGAEATFVARTMDTNVKHLCDTLKRAHDHKGTAFVEIYQNCNVFNDGAFDYVSKGDNKVDHAVFLEHGKPLIFGKNHDKGIRWAGSRLEVVTLGNGVKEDDLVFHDEKAPDPTLAFALSHLRQPEFPEPMGVFRAVEAPRFEDEVDKQNQTALAKGRGTLEKLFNEGDTWTVN